MTTDYTIITAVRFVFLWRMGVFKFAVIALRHSQHTLSNDPMQSIYQLVGQHVSVIVPNELVEMDTAMQIFSLTRFVPSIAKIYHKFRSTNFRYLLFMVCDRKYLQFVRRKLGYLCPLVFFFFLICLLRCCTPSTTRLVGIDYF